MDFKRTPEQVLGGTQVAFYQLAQNVSSCDDVIISHFWFLAKLCHCSKVQLSGNLSWKSHPIWLRCEVVAEKTAVFTLLNYVFKNQRMRRTISIFDSFDCLFAKFEQILLNNKKKLDKTFTWESRVSLETSEIESFATAVNR